MGLFSSVADKKMCLNDLIFCSNIGPWVKLHDKYNYSKTSILDPSNLSQTPILESFIKRPTIYYIETHSESLLSGLKGPFVQGAL